MKKWTTVFQCILMICVLCSCGTSKQKENTNDKAENVPVQESFDRKDAEMRLNLQAGNQIFTATLEDNVAADAFVSMMEEEPVVIQMSDYSGVEKVGPLGRELPSDNRQLTTQAGDIVLYNNNQIVIFYGSNSWSYTKLGKVEDLSGWEDALGDGDVAVTFSIGE
ncbi:cyclophilin-like fold protein [Lachnospiraceae bacterium 45-W7]